MTPAATILALLLGALLLFFFIWLVSCRTPTEDCPAGYIEIEYTIDNVKIKGKNMALTALPNQRIPFTLQPVDRHGNPAPVDEGTVEYWVDDEAVATVEEDPNNELAGAIITTGVGVTQLHYTADADLGEGSVAIEGFDAIEVKSEAAVGFGITFGPAEDL